MNNRSLFQVNLQGLELSDKQTQELESRLTKVTVEYLSSFEQGKAYIKDSVAYKPNPIGPDPEPFPFPWPFPPIFRYPLPYPFPGFYPINRNIAKEIFVEIQR